MSKLEEPCQNPNTNNRNDFCLDLDYPYHKDNIYPKTQNLVPTSVHESRAKNLVNNAAAELDEYVNAVVEHPAIQGFNGFFSRSYLEPPKSSSVFRISNASNGGLIVDWRSPSAPAKVLFQENQDIGVPLPMQVFNKIAVQPRAMAAEAGLIMADVSFDLNNFEYLGVAGFGLLVYGTARRRILHDRMQRTKELNEGTDFVEKRAAKANEGLLIEPGSYRSTGPYGADLPSEYPVVHGETSIGLNRVIGALCNLDNQLANEKPSNDPDAGRALFVTETGAIIHVNPSNAVKNMLETVDPEEHDEFIANTYPDLLDLHFSQKQYGHALDSARQLTRLRPGIPEDDSKERERLDDEIKNAQAARLTAGHKVVSSTFAIGAKWLDHYIHSATKERQL